MPNKTNIRSAKDRVGIFEKGVLQKSAGDDYHITLREDSTDIRLPDNTVFTNTTAATTFGPYSKNKLRQFQIRSNTAAHPKFVNKKRGNKSLASRDRTTISSSRYSKDEERRSNLNKAYMVGNSPPRTMKARGSNQPYS